MKRFKKSNQLGSMYGIMPDPELKRITDPVERAKAYLQRGLESAIKRGLLLPEKTAEAKLYRGQDWQHIGDAFYPARRKPPLNDDEKLTLKCLRDLSRAVNRFARCYADNRQRGAVDLDKHNEPVDLDEDEKDEFAVSVFYANRPSDAFLIAFEIGKLNERVQVLTHAALVGKGRRRNEIETEMRRKAAAKKRIPDTKRRDIISKRQRRMSYGAIARDLKCSKKTVAKVIREQAKSDK